MLVRSSLLMSLIALLFGSLNAQAGVYRSQRYQFVDFKILAVGDCSMSSNDDESQFQFSIPLKVRETYNVWTVVDSDDGGPGCDFCSAAGPTVVPGSLHQETYEKFKNPTSDWFDSKRKATDSCEKNRKRFLFMMEN